MEDQIYKERRAWASFKRKLLLTGFLCALGGGVYFGFLYYRHRHPIDLTPTLELQTHTLCPHPECKTGHEELVRPAEYAPAVLGGLLLGYCVIVTLLAFHTED